MQKPKQVFRAAIPLLVMFMLALVSGCGEQIIVLDPKGPIGQSQKDLIYFSSILCAVILVPVLILTAYIVWRYRDKPENKAAYQPNWSHSTTMEIVWWGIPIIVIIILAITTARYTHHLEPSKPIESAQKPVVIQATSLDWKWLFTYPELGIATVNSIQIPEGVPIKFELTSDAPMNSFWIPQLGGQMYTMSGMAMTLFLQADEPGTYFGSGANFSGEHFADMRFDVKATSQADFDAWVQQIKKSSPGLTMETYDALAKPGKSVKQYYSSFPEGLFNKIVTKYAAGGQGHAHGSHTMGSGQTDMGSSSQTGGDVKQSSAEPKAPAQPQAQQKPEQAGHHAGH
ncbi:ubiquinol oxidase subunit II [Paenibacillus thalictri]|uniref:Quinol oxidase subunit 2 n=1 Tax=Paenibacillus thalictri TaxID=2527873 RepID=A0A4Q9DIL7_9BACL|nr:ubiquinol oxidase subunit II [Paenibacillus thalictri]TBL71048.1 ubiquinol oxidase subunit II [Paenibacillus thalictri]